MIIDEPMGEDCVRVLRFEDGLERLVMCVVDNCVAVDLIRICWLCLQNLTCLFRFGNAHSCRSLLPGSIIHIEQHNFMAHFRESRNCAAAAVLRITGMS